MDHPPPAAGARLGTLRHQDGRSVLPPRMIHFILRRLTATPSALIQTFRIGSYVSDHMSDRPDLLVFSKPFLEGFSVWPVWPADYEQFIGASEAATDLTTD